MKLKRFFIVVMTMLLMFMNMQGATLAKAKDDITGHYFEKDMRILIEKGILGGYGNGVYKPDNPVTRAEFAQLVVKTLDLHPVEMAQFSIASVAEQAFSDVPQDKWYYSSIYAAVEAGIVSGYPDGTFKPNNKITRQEMASMIMRAVDSRGVASKPVTLTFTDKNKIGKVFVDAVQRAVSLEIMSGSYNKFNPTIATPRGQAAAVLNRMSRIIAPPKGLEYKIASFNSDGSPLVIREFTTFQQAKNNVDSNQVVLRGDKIAYMKSGMAVASKFTIIYKGTDLKTNTTYVSTGTEFNYKDATENYVKIELGNQVGYVHPNDVKLIPPTLKKGQSYYEKKGGELYHQVYNPLTNKYAQIHTGKAPSFMREGTKYYSWDGITFTNSGKTVGAAYQYFNYLPLHAKSNYTAAEIDKFLKDNYPDSFKSRIPNSPLAGSGKHFKDAEAKHEVNALYLMANAIHESAWGTSDIAQDKKNLFGINATDSDPYNNATTFASFAESIDFMARQLVANEYHNPKNWKYNGAVLGNKTVGMNVRYASDPYWGEKIAGHMYRADKYLGSKDFNKQSLAVTNIANLNVRPGYGTGSGTPIFTINSIGTPAIFTEKKSQDGATWYKIRTDDKNNRVGYVYGNGSLGQYVKEIQIMK